MQEENSPIINDLAMAVYQEALCTVLSDNMWRAFGYPSGRPKHGFLINKWFRNKAAVEKENFLSHQIFTTSIMIGLDNITDGNHTDMRTGMLFLCKSMYATIGNNLKALGYSDNTVESYQKLCAELDNKVSDFKNHLLPDAYRATFPKATVHELADIKFGDLVLQHAFDNIIYDFKRKEPNWDYRKPVPGNSVDNCIGMAITDVKATY